MDQIKRHYYCTHGGINPSGSCRPARVLDLDAPHGREALGG